MKYLWSIFLLIGALSTLAQNRVLLADPTIFRDQGTYYLYGTGGNGGFRVYTSANMVAWKGPFGAMDGYALTKGDAFGTKGFWAPQVISHHGQFYMFYTANEQIAVAKSDSPLGPFRQDLAQALASDKNQIDPFVFMEGDKKYLYHVRLDKGNRIFVAEMTDDFSAIIPGTLKECINASAGWERAENTSWPVAEGPTVIKHKGSYYLFYSANDFRSIDYAVGYAVAPTPLGPWEKFRGNPIISRHNIGRNGTGHGDLIQNGKGEWCYVLHVHGDTGVSPRVAGLVRLRFVKNGQGPDIVRIEPGSFSLLDLLK